jgi:integrase
LPNSLPNRKKLTDLACARMGPGITWDTVVVGLAIRVGVRARTWIFGVNKRRIGRFPDLSTAEARAKARELLASGVDDSRQLPRVFHDLVLDFLAHARTRKGRELRQNTVDQYRRVFARYGARLHRKPFAEIKRRDIAELLRDVGNESGPTTASLVRGMLHRLWSYAIETGVVENNVVTGTPSYEVPKRSRVLTDSEIAALWRATEDGEAYSLIIRLCLWCGCRRSVAGGARWSEFKLHNFVEVEWRIPGTRTKNHKELVLPLPRQMLNRLNVWPRIVGQDSLFGPSGFGGWSRAKAKLDARLGFSRTFVLHDIRRTVESRLAELGVSKDLRGRILNHGMDPIAQSYDHHHYLPEKQKALQLWADTLEEIVTSAEPAVIKLRSTQHR